MVAQQYRSHDYVNPVDDRDTELPRITEARRYKQQEYNEDKEEKSISNPRYLWVMFSWGVMVVNLMSIAPVVRNMWVMNYDVTSHYSVIVAFIGSFAAIAAIYKFIINRDEENV